MADLKIALTIDANNPNVGDIYLENGTVRLTQTLLEIVSQRLRICLLMFKGEWFLDETQGVPWFQSILGIKNTLANVQRILLSAITQQPGVEKVLSFGTTQLPNRGLQVDFQLQLVNGELLNSASFAPFIVGGNA